MSVDPISRYKHLCDEVATLAVSHGRNPTDVGILAVTKQQPLETFLPLYSAGCLDVGENKIQEALPKMAAASVNFRWHFIGSLQKNKVNKLIGNFYLTHSIDSLDLAEKISHSSLENHCTTALLLEVNTSGEASKHGFSPSEISDHFELLLKLPAIDIQGFMTMAPAEASNKEISNCFGSLRLLRDTLAQRHSHPLPILSMGMSSDYRIAIAEGATLLRIGSALFK